MDGRRIGNPFLTEDTLTRTRGSANMTRAGVFFKLLLLLAIVFIAGGWQMKNGLAAIAKADITISDLRSVPVEGGKEGETHLMIERIDPQTQQRSLAPVPPVDMGSVMPLTWFGLITGFFIGLICIFNKRSAPFLSPLYAACEGLALGGVSVLFEIQFQGITIQAVALTAFTALAMLALFATGILRLSGPVISGIVAATGAIALLYLADILLVGFFGREIAIINSSSPLGIGFSIFVVALAAFNLVIDFHVIEDGIESGADKNYEWYCAFGVLVTLVWLYLEILRLLAKIKNSKIIARGVSRREVTTATAEAKA